MWWSGVLGMVTFGHLFRALGGFPVTIGVVHVPVWVSWMVFPVTGFVSAWLIRRSLDMSEPHVPPPPPWNRLGGLHPRSIASEELSRMEHAYCRIAVGYDFVDEDASEEDE